MVLKFDTTLGSGKTVTVPLASSAAGVSVAWGGAGTANPVGSGSATDQVQVYGASPGDVNFTYTKSGSHTVRICGSVQHYGESGRWVPHADKLVAVSSFGSLGLTSLASAFWGATHLTSVPAILPATVTDTSSMFWQAWVFNQNIAGWDTSQVTTMADMFRDAEAFNQNIGGWDTSKVTNMAEMFAYAYAFNQNIAGWDTSKVTTMADMFAYAGAFNRPIGSWDTSHVTDMSGMFDTAPAFNQPIGAWDTSKVTDMRWLFSGAKAFNKNIGRWNTSRVTEMQGMFEDAKGFNQNIGAWDTSSVTDMQQMFDWAKGFNQNIGGWNTSKVTNMGGMFAHASAFNQNIDSWDTSKVTTMARMFGSANAFNQNIGGWDTSNVTDMWGMFVGSMFNRNIAGWDTSHVTDMSGMFAGSAFNQNIGGWDTSSVIDMQGMFRGSTVFNKTIGGWDTSNVTTMENMFRGARVFNENIGGWDTGNVTTMASMFRGAAVFNQNIGSWDTSSVDDLRYMFKGAKAFNQNIGKWNVTSLAGATDMFAGVSLSVRNYDALLTGWATQYVPKGTVFSGGSSRYTAGGRVGRKILTGTYGWKITDGGLTVGKLAPAPTPTIDDRTPTVAQTLTADPGVWGPAPVKLAYQWYRVNTHGTVHRISGATQATYRVKGADAGYRLKVKVTGTKLGYTTVSHASKPTAMVAKARFTTIPVPTVIVDGTPRVGKIATVTPGTLVPMQDSFSYQWFRGTTPIMGATKLSYKLITADKGRQVKVRVKAYRTGYYTTTRYGLVPGLAQAGLVATTPKLSDVTPVVGQALSITPTTAITVWGPQPVTAGYQWYRGSTAIGGATTATYTVTAADLGKKLKVAITGSKDDYMPVTKTSGSSHPVT